MKRIDKIRIEIQNIARERGHQPTQITYAGRSLKERGERVHVVCETCSASAQGLTNPAPNQTDIAGTLLALNCNVTTK